ncbi:MAG TPA: hypothetical protein VFW24_00960, partial [Acidimicrobiales bacterium]|nr:hypothetical protein [Acidimicrobiales bacterium]
MNWQPPSATPEPDPSTPFAPWGTPGAGPAARPKRRLARAAVIGLPVVLVGAGVATSLSLASGGASPASTPDAAVRALLDSAQQGDLLGVLERWSRPSATPWRPASPRPPA